MSSLNPSETLYRETQCEHGLIGDCRGYVIDDEGLPMDPSEWLASLGNSCPGGSREEMTIDYEAAHAELDIWAYEAEGIRDSVTATRNIVDAALGE